MATIRMHNPRPLCEERPHLCRQAPPTEGPTLTAKAKHAAAAAGRVFRAVATGQPVRVTPEERERRLAICRACPGGYWNEGGNIGLGECKHPDCGCTRFKQGLATETCPAGYWATSTEG